MTDRERANTILNYGIALGADGMTYQQAVEFAMRDIEAIREDERKANHSPDAGSIDALIEQYGRRVPRAMLEEIERRACRNGDIGGCSCLSLNKIAAKYGVKIEEDGK